MKAACMISILLPIIEVSSISIEDCGWPRGWEYQNGECGYKCTVNSEADESGVVLWTAASLLTFDFIKDICLFNSLGQVNLLLPLGLLPSGCNKLEDLVWSTDSCGCPYCKCNAQTSPASQLFEFIRIGEIDAHEWPDELPAKCYDCTCGSSPDPSIADSVYQCDLIASAFDPETWRYYSCPMNTCIKTNYDGSTREYEAGDSWFADEEDNNELCETFCYCDKVGNSICQTGFENILYADENFPLMALQRFNIQACYDINTGLYDTSRIYTTKFGPSCSRKSNEGNGVKCDCGPYSLGETWFMEYQDNNDILYGNAQCIQCECKDDGNGGFYADCRTDRPTATYRVGAQACPPQEPTTNSLQCYTGAANDGLKSTADANGGVLKSCEESNYGNELLNEYSSKKYCRIYSKGFGDNNDYRWECARGYLTRDLLCEAFSHNKCTYTNITAEYTKCDGSIDQEFLSDTHQIQYCCTNKGKGRKRKWNKNKNKNQNQSQNNGDNCNYKDLDVSECSRSMEWENWYKDYIDCIYDPNGPYYTITCDTDLTQITCSQVQQLWTQQSSCICDRYKGIYDLVSSDTQLILQDIVDDMMKDFSEWESIIENCNLTFSCDLSTN